MVDLWCACLNCEDKCCKWSFSYSIFITLKERESLPEINNSKICSYYKNDLCDIHKTRPFDCRFFPFDIINLDNISSYHWIIWDVNCSIVKNNKEIFELYLQEHEKNLIPRFKDYIEEYSKFRLNELTDNYDFKLLRKVKV